jgi:hypothetical protein
MAESKANEIKLVDGFYKCICHGCGTEKLSVHRNAIKRILKNKHCKICNPRIIKDERVSFRDGKYYATCSGCGKEIEFTRKPNAIKMLDKGNCKHCPNAYEKDARIRLSEVGIKKLENKKWSAACPKCNREIIYTSSQAAKRRRLSKNGCKKCFNPLKFNHPENQIINYSSFKMFEKGAKCRGLEWNLKYEDVCGLWNGKCALSNMSLVDGPNYKRTWSLDRIENSKGYTIDNIRIIHKKLNVMRGAMDNDDFINYCIAVADNVRNNNGCSRKSKESNEEARVDEGQSTQAAHG